MATPMTSTLFKTVVSPILGKTFDGLYEEHPKEYTGFMTEKQGMKFNQHVEPVLVGLGMADDFGNGQPITYDQGSELYTQTYIYNTVGLAFALTKETMEDGTAVDLGSTFSEHLARAILEREETDGANILNRSFNSSYVGADGVSLVNSAHPGSTGVTVSNVLATPAALSQTSLEQMLVQIRKAKNLRNLPIKLKPKKLIVSPDNMLVAKVLLKTVGRTGTTNNDINPVMGELDADPEVVTRLTSTTAWWISTDCPQSLQFMRRRKVEKSMEGDFETDSMRYKATTRYNPGWTNFYGVFGTPGV